MQNPLLQDTSYLKENVLAKGDYENCNFKNCDLSNQDLSGFRFTDCSFIACNLSMAKLHKSILNNILFKDCKLLGLRFDTCNAFGLSFHFENCLLNHASFYKTRISKTTFKNCQLHDCDFTESELVGSVFDNCDLSGAMFEKSNLEKVDFRTSLNFFIDPENNKLKKARFSIQGLPGLLYKYGIEIEE